jgi:uracil-DNA glycosylase family 4
VSDVRSVAAGCASWTELAARAQTCTACTELAATRNTVVPGTAPAGAALLLVGEAPGAAEDASGTPFVGRSGVLLTGLLAEAGIDRDSVAITNVVKCRPPGNRTPTRSEIEHCRPWLARQLELLDPALTVLLGGTATAWAFGRSARVAALRGEAQLVDGRRMLATYHPSAAIRFGPRGAPLAALHADLQLAARLLGVPPARIRADAEPAAVPVPPSGRTPPADRRRSAPGRPR